MDKILHDIYLCLVESNKQQIEEVRSKTQVENSESRATPADLNRFFCLRYVMRKKSTYDNKLTVSNNIARSCSSSGVAMGLECWSGIRWHGFDDTLEVNFFST